MVFSSFVFLCIFLPIVLTLHTVVENGKFRNGLLVAASVFFYAYGEPVYVLLLLLSVLLNYGAGLLTANHRRRWLLIAAVCMNLGLLVVFKYSGFLTESLNLLLPKALRLPVPQLRLPIGISFYTFQALSYVADVYRGDVRPQKSFFRLLLYISFFPQLIAGPIVKYHDVEAQIEQRFVCEEHIKRGIFRFSCGLGKKILIANTMAYVADEAFAVPNAQVGLLTAWVGALSYLMQIYFDFSGYSDMAIGLGHMFGFHFQENFRYPYISASVQDFWRRWHISLSTWFKEYLYIPLGGNRRGKRRAMQNRFIVFLATGIWHGANWTFLFWGVYHGLLLTGEQTDVIPVKKWKSRALCRLYTIFAVMVGFVLFRADTLLQAGVFLKALFGLGAFGGTGFALTMKLLRPYQLFIFGVAVLGCTPYPRRLWRAFVRNGRMPAWQEIVSMAMSLLILLLSYMALASDSYNPFIYFRF